MTDEGVRPRPKSRPKRREAPTTPDPVEIAMEAHARGDAPEGPAHAVLTKTARLLDWQIASERFGVILKGLTGLAGVVAALLLAGIAWDASRYRGLVVQPFAAPSDMATDGLTGQVLASRVLDQLNVMQKAWASEAYNLSDLSHYSAQVQSIELEIPQTGVSVDEVQRFLRERLGHPTYITGDLAREADGLVLTVRVGPNAYTVRGAPGDLTVLTAKAAEAVFSDTQPRGYAEYLLTVGRPADAIPVYKRLVSTGDRTQHAWGYIGWGDALRMQNDPTAAERRYRQAAQEDPSLWVVWQNLADLQTFSLQDSEAAYQSRVRTVAAAGGAGRGADARRRFFQDFSRIYVAEAKGDFATALKLAVKLGEVTSDRALAFSASDYAAYEAAYLHDNAQSQAWAQRMVDRSDEDHVDVADQRSQRIAYWQAANVDDWARAAELMRGSIEMDTADMNPRIGTLRRRNAYFISLQQTAFARSGQVAAAQALGASSPTDCYVCKIADAETAAASGDVAGSERLFAEAIRLAPSLVRAEGQAAAARLRRGDLDGAIQMAERAVAKGPNYADALETWGEALLRKGNAEAAAAKFAATAKLAPAWGRNRLRWGQALNRLGKAEAAQAQFRAAQPLALSAADRRELTTELARRPG